MKDLATEVLEDELAVLWGNMSAAMARFCALLVELEERGGWAEGFVSFDHWLGWRCGIDARTARAYLRVARALKNLPGTTAALQTGEISYSKVRAITRVAKADNEETLLDFARNATAAQVERITSAWRRSEDNAREESDRIESRRFANVFVDDEGMVVVRARLAPDEGAVFMRAMDAAREELWKGEKAEGAAAQQRADQLALLADRSLSEGASARKGGDRVMVLVHMDAEAGSAEPDRRQACDASVVEVEHHENGDLTAGRKTRVISSALRRALRVRDDDRCTFPSCTHRVVDAHHIQHWANGGPTVLSNIVSVCRRHHTLLHEGGFRVELTPAGARFFRPDGRPVLAAPPRRGSAEPLPGSAGPWSLAPLVTSTRIDWDAMIDHLPT